MARRVKSKLAKALVEEINKGYYDEDCRALGALFQARARYVEQHQDAAAKLNWKTGEQATFVWTDRLYPKYLNGALVEVTTTSHHGTMDVRIKDLVRKPRGGPPRRAGQPGTPPVYQVGDTVRWVHPRNLKPLDDMSKEFEAIRQQYLNP